MRILIVHSDYAQPWPSGEAQAVESQRDALNELGHEVLIWPENKEKRKISHAVASGVGTQVFGVGLEPTTFIRSTSPDLILLHNLFPFIGERWLEDNSVPVISFLHNYRLFCAAGTLTLDKKTCFRCADDGVHSAIVNRCYRGSYVASSLMTLGTLRSKLGRLAIERPQAFVALSQRSRSNFLRLGINREKIHLIPNFSPLERTVSSRAPVERRWLYLGRLSEEKGILNVISMWDDSFELLVAGDGPLRNEAIMRAEGRNIRFVGAVFDQAEKSRLLEESQGLVFPSEVMENSPLSYLEAISMGLPVITFSENVVSDDFRVGGHGRLVQNTRDLSDALHYFEGNSNSRKLSRAYYFDNYSREAWKTRFNDLVEIIV